MDPSTLANIDMQGVVLGTLILDLATVIIFLLFILFTESLILWGMDWGSFPRSLLTALMMNVVSFIVVFFVINAIPDVGWLYVLIAVTLSIIIEGLILTLLKRYPVRKTWLFALVANLGSTLILVAVVYLKAKFT